MGHGSFSETVSFPPSADTTLIEAFPANNFGSNEFFNAGTTQNYTKNRALLKFDLAGHVPAGAKITSVSLTLEVVGVPVDGNTPSGFELRRVLRDWGEGNKAGHPPQQSGLGKAATTNEACWTHRFASTTNAWSVAGGAAGVDFSTNTSSAAYVYGMDFSPYTFNTAPHLVADAQTWLNQPAQNFGWLLLTQSEGDNFTARRVGSREDPFRAPVLTVDYFLPRLESLSVNGSGAKLQFTAEAGVAYGVEWCDAPNSGGWQTLTNLAPSAATTGVEIHDPATAWQRYYRLVCDR